MGSTVYLFMEIVVSGNVMNGFTQYLDPASTSLYSVSSLAFTVLF